MEKRKHRRHAVAFDICCRKAGEDASQRHRGRTVNASCGGLYFSTSSNGFNPGALVEVDMSIPPLAGIHEKTQRITARGRIIRTDKISNKLEGTKENISCYGIALEFCQKPRFII